MERNNFAMESNSAECAKRNRNIEASDFIDHIGSVGTDNHGLGNGVQPGFSTNDFTNSLKEKLEGIENGALNNPYPPTHPHITGGRICDFVSAGITAVGGFALSVVMDNLIKNSSCHPIVKSIARSSMSVLISTVSLSTAAAILYKDNDDSETE